MQHVQNLAAGWHQRVRLLHGGGVDKLWWHRWQAGLNQCRSVPSTAELPFACLHMSHPTVVQVAIMIGDGFAPITAPPCLYPLHSQVAIVTGGDSGIGRSVALLFCSITAPLCLHLMKLVAALQSQVAIVTGGDSGIGRSVALLLAKEGAKAVAIVHTPKEQKVGC